MPLAWKLPVSTDNFSFDFKVKRFLLGAPHPPAVRNQVWLGSFDRQDQRSLLAEPEAGFDPYEDIAAAEAECDSEDPVGRMIYMYSRFYLADDILTKADRASMACSLEVRAPLLDWTFVEFLNSLPSEMKLRGFTSKYILKRAMQDKLPPGIAHRGKKGFGIPVAKWFRGDLRELVLDTLSQTRIHQQGIFRWTEIERLLRDHLRGSRDNRKQLWTLFMFQLWYERYAQRPARAVVS